jgi:hypothetical protein
MRFASCTLLGAVVVLVVGAFQPSFLRLMRPASTPIELLVPAYFYPSGENLMHWDNVAIAARKVPVTAIVNPSSGPGKVVDPAYASTIDKTRQAGAKVIGYISTAYAARPLIDVIGDMNRYVANYPIDGFFIDEMANDESSKNVNYYLAIYRYAKGVNDRLRVVMNPGTATPELYLSMPLADAIVTFEAGHQLYRRAQVSDWVRNYGNDQFAHLVYDVSSVEAAMGFVSLAQQRNAGLIYVTSDGRMGNPWDTLPTYWSELVREVCRRNRSKNC